MRYDWVFFDADGTLFDYGAAEAAALRGAFEACALPFEPSVGPIYTEINAAIWREFERGEISQEALKTERFDRLFERLGLTADAEAFSRRYLVVLGGQAGLLDGAESVVRALHGRLKLVLLTNGLADVQRPRFAASSIGGFFSEIVISEEVGLAKPDPAIFDLVFERIDGPPRSSVLMVGDSLSSDIAGGAAAGLDTCWYNPAGVANGHGVEPTFEIRELRDLLAII